MKDSLSEGCIKALYPMFGGFIAVSSIPFGETPEEIAAKAEADRKAAEEAAARAASEKKYTDKELEDRVTLTRKKTEAENRKVVEQLNELKKKASLTEDEKTKLSAQIESMEKTYMTDKEIQQRQHEQQLATEKAKGEAVIAERDDYKKKFTTYVTENTILQEAVAAEAVVPQQVYQMLKDQTQLAEDIGADGKPTGKQVPKVTFEEKDKDGKTVVLVLGVKEAVKHMKEMPETFGNLFKSGATGGVGSTTRAKAGAADGGPSTDTETYIAQRKAQAKQ